jgi:serpin B
MTKRTPLICFAFSSLSSLGLMACSGSASQTTPGAPPVAIDQAQVTRAAPSPAALGVAVAANNAFALKLYGQVPASAAIGGNLLTSPLSASLALTMTYAGAQGQTQSEMAAALQIDPTASSIFDGQNALSQGLASRAAAALAGDTQNAQESQSAAPSASDYAVQVVNSVWGEKTYSWATPFLDVLGASYGTGVYEEDFIGNPNGATTTINDWVSSETAGKIVNLVPPGAIDPHTRMVLVNAVHLKLPWASPFDPSQTAPGAFTRGDGSTVSASLMHEEIDAGYVETPDAQVVSLPLSGGQLSVVFALPKNGLANLVSSLTPATWAAMTNTTTADVILTVPKFSFTSDTFSLAPALQTLGMKTAFDPSQADFKGLCAAPPDGENLYIGDVIQKAMMAVAETGVEAAAATAVLVAGTTSVSLPVPVPVVMTIDRPFLVSIVDSSGAIVFLGQINDPTNAGTE